MLSSFKRGIITLINNALKGEQNPLPEDFDYSRLYDFAVRQQILPLIYYGIRKDSRFWQCPDASRIKHAAIYSAAVSDHQLQEVEDLCVEFDKIGIDYMKLKGTVLKKIYPRRDMRVMGDADILIREDQMSLINDIMLSHGYKFIIDGEYEWMWKKGVVKIELHKKIVSSNSRDFFAYFDTGWKLANKKDDWSGEYVMSSEDEFVYLVTHFARHYRYAGIGIRHAVDIYIYMETHYDLDMDYVNRAFKQLGIDRFFANICKMLDVWFGEAECDEISEFLTNKIFENGAYGTSHTSKKSQALVLSKGTDVKGAKRKKMLSLICPTYKNMCPAYPWIKGRPLLLPVAWIYRIIKVLLFKRDRIKLHRNDIKSINKDNIDSYQAELNVVGLDFNFEV